MTISAILWDFGGVLTSSPFEAFKRFEIEHGMPEGAGVALGLDRLIQLALGKARLEDVLTFSTPHC